MRGEAGLVLATEHEGHAGSQATEHEIGCINEDHSLFTVALFRETVL